MADRQESQVVTCPALTPTTAPVEIQLTWPGGIVRHVEIVIPDGHAGLTGIALGYGHNFIIPRSNGGLYSGNDDIIRRYYNDRQQGVQWSAFLVNGDTIAHSWEVRFDLDELAQQPTPAAATFIAPSEIVSAGGIILPGG